MKRASTRIGLAAALGKVQPDGVYRIGLPRTDLKVTVEASRSSRPLRSARTSSSWPPAARTLGAKTKAAITGDFALLAAQVNPVIRALRAHDIDVTALHSHMLDAQPTVYFMHFFAKGEAVTLARGLRAGLNAMG